MSWWSSDPCFDVTPLVTGPADKSSMIFRIHYLTGSEGYPLLYQLLLRGEKKSPFSLYSFACLFSGDDAGKRERESV
ncbi:hypothetical protein EMGBS15_08490 [Filimonas sp.]|nr:hypothetical protein EMGBS15_08490 [Filimonas sp.]